MQSVSRGVSFVRFRIPSRLFAALVLVSCVGGWGLAQTPILTWHYNNLRNGANTSEVVLTHANVNYHSFGKLSTKPVDGYVVAQPLYVPNLNVSGQGVHNVVFVATMHDSVYAFDADDASNSPLWHTSILNYSPSGATTVPATVKRDASTTGWVELGIISTPVINLSNSTLYLVAETYENSHVVHRLHALDITTGKETLGGPTTISAQQTSNGVTTVFKDLYQMNRPGLLLNNGTVFIAWGTNGDNAPGQGWVMAYSASTLQRVGAVTIEPGKNLASIWQKGAGVAADPNGNLYTVSAEGAYVAGSNLSMSVVKYSGGVQIADFFTPYNHQVLNSNDMDLTGLLILPPQSGAHPREMIAMGKEGTIYVLNLDNLGGFCASCTSGDTQIVQEVVTGGRGGGNPSFWNNRLYLTPTATPVLSYTVSNGKLVLPAIQGSVRLSGGGHSFITANGNSNGILWLINGRGIRAMDAISMATLYINSQAPNQRDALPVLPHFPEPIIADGKLFIGTTNSLITYGLF